MPELSRSERRLRAQVAAHTSWAQTADRTARTEPGRHAFRAKFERQVDPEGRLSVEELAARAESARQAHYARLAFESAKARRNRAAEGGGHVE